MQIKEIFVLIHLYKIERSSQDSLTQWQFRIIISIYSLAETVLLTRRRVRCDTVVNGLSLGGSTDILRIQSVQSLPYILSRFSQKPVPTRVYRSLIHKRESISREGLSFHPTESTTSNTCRTVLPQKCTPFILGLMSLLVNITL